MGSSTHVGWYYARHQWRQSFALDALAQRLTGYCNVASLRVAFWQNVFVVSQHFHYPEADEWYAGWEGGDCGPYKSAEEAICGSIRWLHRIYEEAATERDDYLRELLELRKQLDGDHLLPEWQRAFRQ